ncbi:MAG TPA: accessory Sec system translocase SecA2 [Myxococcota bacterium]|nr:accessory Sec system translocase SecA2 [Myxococcota bacterium]HRY97232.1 accessory Sec system translocase SecA2 [Myxococcota bacterium]HSA24239.1 accessory Sec system translocase SecA2 [Myxococcota bacterium]
MDASATPTLGRATGTPGALRRWVDRWRGRRVEYDLRHYLPRLARVLGLEGELRAADLRARADRLRERARGGADLDELLPEAFALVREAGRRALGLSPYPVQVLGGLALHQAKVAELETGEGKTLVAVLPAVLHALSGQGVHVLTFNDYLARRDARWMGPIYELLGVSVAHLEAGSGPEARRQAYQADVTYLTAKEAGFDYLRDGLRPPGAPPLQRPFHFAIVDEADSILIDEARVPLVIAGSRAPQAHQAARLCALVRSLEPGLHFETDGQGRNVFLTEAGLDVAERELGRGGLHGPENAGLLCELNLALHAEALLRRDVDYIVRGGRIELVDELTGRVVKDRHWPDGLQAALEAKEGLRFGAAGEILGTVTLQHFLGLYPLLAGMTGTARGGEEELDELYGLGVVVVPPNRPCQRRDLPDRLFTHREAKRRALLAAIAGAHARGQPVLVGTASVRESEELAAELAAAGLGCQVLNAKTDELEARIVAEAGAPGALTISTNMAGRGTDIRLGGADGGRRAEVVAAGGLYVIGTNRHESQRIDRQLRGRAGRQGDPGVSELFVSLEDELIVRYGVDELLPAARRARQDEPLADPRVRRRIDWAQRVIAGQNFDIRRNLWRYSAIQEVQRADWRARREALVQGAPPAPSRWAAARPARRAALVAACGAERAEELERRVALHAHDRLWTEHLAALAEMREGIHMVRLGAMDPLTEFQRQADLAFQELGARLEADCLEALERLEPSAAGLERLAEELRGPSSTWTYLVDDDPFRDRMGLRVAGDLALSLGAALYYPLYIAGALVERFRRRPR